MIIIAAAGGLQASSWDFGGKLGLNQTTLVNGGGLTSIEGIKAGDDLTIGVYTENRFGNFYGIYCDMAYSNRKTYLHDYYSLFDPDLGNYIDYLYLLNHKLKFAMETNFIDLAAFLKLFPPGLNKINPYFYGGPVLSFLVSGTKKPVDVVTPKSHQDIFSTSTDISYAIGFGVDFNYKGIRSSLDIRMIRGFNWLTYIKDTTSQPAVPPLNSGWDLKFKNNVISATLGISLFRL